MFAISCADDENDAFVYCMYGVAHPKARSRLNPPDRIVQICLHRLSLSFHLLMAVNFSLPFSHCTAFSPPLHPALREISFFSLSFHDELSTLPLYILDFIAERRNRYDSSTEPSYRNIDVYRCVWLASAFSIQSCRFAKSRQSNDVIKRRENRHLTESIHTRPYHRPSHMPCQLPAF